MPILSLDFFDISTMPLPYIFAILTGYIFAQILAGETSFWKNRQIFEKILIGGALGFLLFFGIAFPLVTLGEFFFPSLFLEPLEASGYLIMTLFLFLPLSLRIKKISSSTILKGFSYVTQIFPYVMIIVVFIVFSLIEGVKNYPEYMRLVLSPMSITLRNKALVATFFAYFNFLTFFYFVQPLIERNVREIPTIDMRWGKKKEKSLKERFQCLTHKMRCQWTLFRIQTFSNKRIFLIILLLFLIASPMIFTKIDSNSHIVTAKLQEFEEIMFSPSDVNPELVMNLTQDLRSENFLVCFYELRFKNYCVTLPDNPYGIKSVQIKNPSSYSKIGNIGLFNPYVTSLNQVNNLWVIGSEDNESITFLSNAKNVDNLILDFSNVSSLICYFNITYFQKFYTRDVLVNWDIDYGELNNNTQIDEYSFAIHNNENRTLVIPQIEINALSVADCDHDNVEIYLNGDPRLRSVDSTAIYVPSLCIQPLSSGTITVKIPRVLNAN